MPACEIIDFKCLFVNEIAGSVTLAVVLFLILYFVAASRMKIGFDTTVYFLFPIIIIASAAVGGFAVIFAFATVFSAIMIGWIINKIVAA
ncbi:hypothetical protein LCGC14_0546170 [marine sediment metagenome]|uniref:Uncharacterized protein n=1 Tax=marine sediment metagenome TaxID=412755 RepID=A0A0F9S9U3_9ZZZZ